MGNKNKQTVAIAEAQGIELGLMQLNTIPIEFIKNYQPYWTLKAHLLKQLGSQLEAQLDSDSAQFFSSLRSN